jgi:thiol-disulfide isomerase/thioredoxin
MSSIRTNSALSALDGAPIWLNSEPLTANALRGRIVLVDFWTYSCVNWLRTLPYVRAWHERYGERGLAVVGTHAPEFGFEHDLDSEPSPKWWNRTRPSRSTRYEEIERAIQLLPGIDEQTADAAGEGAGSEPRAHQLIRHREAAERTFEITFREGGVCAYVFTFG